VYKKHVEKPEWLENKLKSADFLLLAIKDVKIVGYSLHETWDIEDNGYLEEDDNESLESSDDGLGSVDASVDDLEPLNELDDKSVSSKSSADTFEENMDEVSPYWYARPRTNCSKPDLLPTGSAITSKPCQSCMREKEFVLKAPFQDYETEVQTLMSWKFNVGAVCSQMALSPTDGDAVANERLSGAALEYDERVEMSENGHEFATRLLKSGEKRSANEYLGTQEKKWVRNVVNSANIIDDEHPN
jgi:hypothetical protein